MKTQKIMKLYHFILVGCLLINVVVAQEITQRKQGHPLDKLPENIEILTQFGERADFSPDNTEVAFMAKSFGDAMVIDLKTRQIRCLTCNVPGAAFLRVMHLPTGDYILIGPDHFEDINTSRWRDNELWFLSKEPGSKPMKLGEKMSEGLAISKKSLKIAYADVNEQQEPGLPKGHSRLVVAELEISGQTAKLINRKTVYESKDRGCTIEPQDFYANDNKMTFSCYEPNHLSSVKGIDLTSGEVTDFSKSPGKYNEVEGIVSDEYTLVESDRQCDWLGGDRGPWNIDIWKLKLDGTAQHWERLTRFNDYEGHKASNPVVSTDGKYMAFQRTSTSEPAGVGFGILLYRFDQ